MPRKELSFFLMTGIIDSGWLSGIVISCSISGTDAEKRKNVINFEIIKSTVKNKQKMFLFESLCVKRKTLKALVGGLGQPGPMCKYKLHSNYANLRLLIKFFTKTRVWGRIEENLGPWMNLWLYFVTSNVCQFLHVSFQKSFEALRILVQIFDLLSQIEIFTGQTLNLVLKTSLRVVRRRLVDGLRKLYKS